MRIWKALALLVVPAALVTSAVTATSASASTPGCTGGPWLGYCATQADNASPALVIDAKGQKAAYNNPVIGWTDSTTDPATDWFQLAYAGDNTLGVMFAFAPGGAISDWCMSDPGNGQVVERQCNGSNWQRWIATQVGSSGFFTWTNRATHHILSAGTKGAQLTTIAAPATVPGTSQWKFSN